MEEWPDNSERPRPLERGHAQVSHFWSGILTLETINGRSAVEDMFADPEPLDEDDPEMKVEMFELHQSSGDRPEDLVGASPEFRKEYAEWLAKNEL
jgi:hypothetical protein